MSRVLQLTGLLGLLLSVQGGRKSGHGRLRHWRRRRRWRCRSETQLKAATSLLTKSCSPVLSIWQQRGEGVRKWWQRQHCPAIPDDDSAHCVTHPTACSVLYNHSIPLTQPCHCGLASHWPDHHNQPLDHPRGCSAALWHALSQGGGVAVHALPRYTRCWVPRQDCATCRPSKTIKASCERV